MRVFVACALLFVSGCGSSVQPGSGGGGGFVCPSGNDGILLIDWTVRGAAPGMTSCNDIASMTLYLTSQLCGQVEIEPVPCALDKFRYDDMPVGQGEVVLQGFDSKGTLQIAGSGLVTLSCDAAGEPDDDRVALT